MDKIKGLDASAFPPCEGTFSCHVKRAAFVAAMWAGANRRDIIQHPTEKNGWEIVENRFRIIWYTGEQFPENLNPTALAADETALDDENLSLSSDDESDIIESDDEGIEQYSFTE